MTVVNTAGVTVRFAFALPPTAEAVIAAVEELPTADLEITKLVDVCPSGTTTVAGVEATLVFALATLTLTPPAGAGEDNVRMALMGDPPMTADGCSDSDAGGGGMMVRSALIVEGARLALIDAVDATFAGAVATANVAEVDPAATVTVLGTVARPLELLSATTFPPVTAGASSVAMRVTLLRKPAVGKSFAKASCCDVGSGRDRARHGSL